MFGKSQHLYPHVSLLLSLPLGHDNLGLGKKIQGL